MATLTPTVPSRLGTATPGAAVASSDTIPSSAFGSRGVLLEILNGNASVDNITISDAGSTPAGSPLTGGNYAVSVTNGTNKIFMIRPQQLNPSTKVVTITHSVTATVTYKLYPLG